MNNESPLAPPHSAAASCRGHSLLEMWLERMREVRGCTAPARDAGLRVDHSNNRFWCFGSTSANVRDAHLDRGWTGSRRPRCPRTCQKPFCPLSSMYLVLPRATLPESSTGSTGDSAYVAVSSRALSDNLRLEPAGSIMATARSTILQADP